MEESPKTSNRRKFLLWSATILSSLTLLKFIPATKKEKKETVKMLTQDGKLVEVEIDKLNDGKRNRISDEELKSFVKKNKISG